MTMTDFAVFVIFTFILFGFIFITGFTCGYVSKAFEITPTKNKIKKLVETERWPTPPTTNMIYKKYKQRYPGLTKRFIRNALE
jgi:hypothetical protein